MCGIKKNLPKPARGIKQGFFLCPAAVSELLGNLTLDKDIQGIIAKFVNYPPEDLSKALAKVPSPARESEFERYNQRLHQVLNQYINHCQKKQLCIDKLRAYIDVMDKSNDERCPKGLISQVQQNKDVLRTHVIAKSILSHLTDEQELELSIADYQLIRKKPKLLEILALIYQGDVITDLMQTQYETLCKALQTKTHALIVKGTEGKIDFNPRYKNIAEVASTLNDKLLKAGKDFFAHPACVHVAAFKDACHDAIGSAEAEFKKNRSPWSLESWNELHPILKRLLGILALLTVIPALMVSVKSTHGFTKTFFGYCQTDSSDRLHDFEKG
ncbi:MAG: hypothetical protein H0U75_05950 [Legionella sp.]|nr:hypothetical protein [Legionella sp.]